MQVGLSIICLPYFISLGAYALAALLMVSAPSSWKRLPPLLLLLALAFTTPSFLVLHVVLLPI
jgi:hypothetical protein